MSIGQWPKEIYYYDGMQALQKWRPAAFFPVDTDKTEPEYINIPSRFTIVHTKLNRPSIAAPRKNEYKANARNYAMAEASIIEEIRASGDKTREEIRHLRNEICRPWDGIQAQMRSASSGGVRLQWTECDERIPIAMGAAKVAIVAGSVYVGGACATPAREDDYYKVLRYGLSTKSWHDDLPLCSYRFATLAHFRGKLVTIGGLDRREDDSEATNKLFTLEDWDLEKRWTESLPPMPTARYRLSVATTDTAIVAAGGKTQLIGGVCDKVEVYCHDHGASRWHTVEPGLPLARRDMSSVVIGGMFHLIGGFFDNGKSATNSIYAPLASLIEQAISPHPIDESPWKTTRDTPLVECSATGLLGSLVAVGGARSNGDREVFSAVYYHDNNSSEWVKLTGELPAPRSECTIAHLAPDEIMVIGGFDNVKRAMDTVYLGRICMSLLIR